MLLQRLLCAGTRCSRPRGFWIQERVDGTVQRWGTNPHTPGLRSEARAVSCCWPRMETMIPGAQQESGSHCNSQDSEKYSGIWRSNCSPLYCSILNLHLLYAKRVLKPVAVHRRTNSGRPLWLHTVLISLLPNPILHWNKSIHSSKIVPKIECLRFRLQQSNILFKAVGHEDAFVLLWLLLMPTDYILCFHLALHARIFSETLTHSSSYLLNRHEGAWSVSL